MAARLPLNIVHLGHSHRPTSAGRMEEHLHLLRLGHLMRMWQRPPCTLYTWDACRRVWRRHHWGDPLALPGEFMLRQTLAELGVSLLHDADVAGGASETRARERHRQIDHRDARRDSACPPHLRHAPVEEIRKLMLETVHRVSGDKRLRGGEPEFSFDMGWWGMENCFPCGILGDPSPRDSAYLPAKTARSDTLRRQAEYLWGPCVAVDEAQNLGHVGPSRGC